MADTAASTLRGPKSKILNTYRAVHDPKRWIAHWAHRYGSIFQLPALDGRWVVLTTSALAREVFAMPSERFAAVGKSQLRAVAGRGSILCLDGQEHRRQRKLLMPPFAGAKLANMSSRIAQLSLVAVRKHSVGQRFSARDLGLDVALQTIFQVVYGLDRAADLTEMARLVREGSEATRISFMVMPSLQREWYPPFRRFRRATRAWNAALASEVARRRADADLGSRSDILSLLMHAQSSGEVDDIRPLNDEEVLDQLRALLFAGHETSATIFAVTLDLLLRHPQQLARVQDEVDGLPIDSSGCLDAPSVMKLPVLGGACDEAMRLFPILPSVVREAKSPIEIGGHTIPEGWNIGVNIHCIHDDPEIYPEPTRFSPDRFIERRYAPHEYIPFGGGHRRCIGAQLAIMEQRIAVATALRHANFRLLGEAPRMVRRSPVLNPDNGIPVEISGWR